MSQSSNWPAVCAIMLKNGRPEMARQAIAYFRAQTYPNKRLLIWDSSPELGCCDQTEHEGVYQVPAIPRSVGEMRNEAAAFWTEFPILIHWDSDDYSHPNRIAEQVALLQSSGADCVGYREMLFWRQPELLAEGRLAENPGDVKVHSPGQAWLYTNGNSHWALGTSLCYWRKSWERTLFPAKNHGEDTAWLHSQRVVSVPAYAYDCTRMPDYSVVEKRVPRMIARVHAGNASNPAYDLATMWHHDAMLHRAEANWKRVPGFDDYCRRLFA